jgi:hypothetical protein
MILSLGNVTMTLPQDTFGLLTRFTSLSYAHGS